ncbi:MAG: hypothetical protein U0168_07685 [Nannocystaceae bacterium]
MALLDDADAKIGRGELDAAAGVLGQARSLASDDVAALDRIGRAESRIAIARLAASAAESRPRATTPRHWRATARSSRRIPITRRHGPRSRDSPPPHRSPRPIPP